MIWERVRRLSMATIVCLALAGFVIHHLTLFVPIGNEHDVTQKHSSNFRPRTDQTPLVNSTEPILVDSLSQLTTADNESVLDQHLPNEQLICQLWTTEPNVSSESELVKQPNASKQSVHLLIIVHSAPDHHEQRQLIRETWARPPTNTLPSKRPILTVFFIGQLVNHNDTTEAMMLQREIELYSDIVQGDYQDTYRNLTLKAVHWLHWANTNCRQADFVLKTDDDMLINSHKLITHLETKLRWHNDINNTVHCLKWTRGAVQRNRASKWYVSEQEYNGTEYSAYCSGAAYLLTYDLIAKFTAASKVTPFFWIDDYYVTGLLTKAVGARLEHSNSVYQLHGNSVFTHVQRFVEENAMFLHLPSISYSDRYLIWNLFLRNNQL